MPELPEVETMVRGLRPAMAGRTLRSVDGPRPLALARAARPRSSSDCAAGAVVDRVERRGKWVVIALGGDRGIIVIQPRMTGGFWLVSPPRPEHIRMTFHLDGSHGQIWFCDARRLGRIAWYSGPEEAARAFDRSHGPDALEIGRDDAGRAALADGAGDQADLDGPEGAGRDRQHLRRRDPLPGAAPPRADRRTAHGPRRSTACTRRSARSWPRRSRRKVRASTRATAPCSGWKGDSWRERHVWPRGKALSVLRVRDPEDQDRRPDRPPHSLLPPVPARPAAEAVASALRSRGRPPPRRAARMSSRPRTDVGLLWEVTSGYGRSRDKGSETTPSRLP